MTEGSFSEIPEGVLREATLDPRIERSVHDVVRDTGMTLTVVRRTLGALVDLGAVTATAPPTSRRRRYLVSTSP
jgi:DNA-binding transcriptional ArsR family regulator